MYFIFTTSIYIIYLYYIFNVATQSINLHTYNDCVCKIATMHLLKRNRRIKYNNSTIHLSTLLIIYIHYICFKLFSINLYLHKILQLLPTTDIICSKKNYFILTYMFSYWWRFKTLTWLLLLSNYNNDVIRYLLFGISERC